MHMQLRSKTEIFFLFLLTFISCSWAQVQPQVCPNLDKSFLKVTYSVEGTRATFNLQLLNYTSKANPIAGGLIIVRNVSSLQPICYLVSNKDGNALVSFDLKRGECHEFLFEFKPDGEFGRIYPCNDGSQSPFIYSNSFIGSRFGTKLCIPPEKKANLAVCWLATLVGGLIFAASFMMGRNPLLFFDFSASRQLSPRFSSVQAGYGPMIKSQDSQTGFEKFQSAIQGAIKTTDEGLNTFKHLKGDSKSQAKSKESVSPKPAEDGKTDSPTSSTLDSKGKDTSSSTDPKNQDTASQPPNKDFKYILNEVKGWVNNPVEKAVGKFLSSEDQHSSLLTGVISGGAKALVQTITFAVTPRKKTQKKPTLGSISKTFALSAVDQVVWTNLLTLSKDIIQTNLVNNELPFKSAELKVAKAVQDLDSPNLTEKERTQRLQDLSEGLATLANLKASKISSDPSLSQEEKKELLNSLDINLKTATLQAFQIWGDPSLSQEEKKAQQDLLIQNIKMLHENLSEELFQNPKAVINQLEKDIAFLNTFSSLAFEKIMGLFQTLDRIHYSTQSHGTREVKSFVGWAFSSSFATSVSSWADTVNILNNLNRR